MLSANLHPYDQILSCNEICMWSFTVGLPFCVITFWSKGVVSLYIKKGSLVEDIDLGGSVMYVLGAQRVADTLLCCSFQISQNREVV